jgi:hypothetical protein
MAVAFHPSGRLLLTGGEDQRVLLWNVPEPLDGSVERIRLWVETETAMELNAQGTVRQLNPDTLRKRLERLKELGGPPG